MTSPFLYTMDRPRSISYDQYLEESSDVINELVEFLIVLAANYQDPQLSRNEWMLFLASVYPYVEEARRKMARLARDFYDSERADHLDTDVNLLDHLDEVIGPDGRPGIVQNDAELVVRVFERLRIDLPYYSPDWFEDNMEEFREDFQARNAKDSVIVRVAGRVQREAEMAARSTILQAVRKEPHGIRWARVEGNENIGSCGFCAMLISRGPVYRTAQSAGLSIGSEAAISQYNSGDIPASLMTKWHDNCDCKVVPVFDTGDWPGKEMHEQLEQLWKETTKGLSNTNKAKSAVSSPAFHAFRRAVERRLRDR